MVSSPRLLGGNTVQINIMSAVDAIPFTCVSPSHPYIFDRWIKSRANIAVFVRTCSRVRVPDTATVNLSLSPTLTRDVIRQGSG